MKKILYSLLFIFTVIFTACEEDLPKASFDLYELKSLTATAGDMNGDSFLGSIRECPSE